MTSRLQAVVAALWGMVRALRPDHPVPRLVDDPVEDLGKPLQPEQQARAIDDCPARPLRRTTTRPRLGA